MKYEVRFTNEIDYLSAGRILMKDHSPKFWKTLYAKKLTIYTDQRSSYNIVLKLCKTNNYEYETLGTLPPREEVLITGASSGIGLSSVKKFLDNGHIVVGIDISPSPISHENYSHWIGDVSNKYELARIPLSIPEFEIVVNNAGTVDSDKAYETNVKGYINVVDRFCNHPKLKCLINVNSISGHTGLDELENSVSQGARLALTKHLAITLGKKYKTRVVGISPGAVRTNLEPKLYKDVKAMAQISNENILKRWSTPEDIANWIYFIAIVDRSTTGQNIVVDNGEMANYNFIEVRD